ncbi:Uncharacterised protein [Mycobacterium tuberculosis]|uniref:Uncharacterized protein n=1 Tax=Mycobacterium tuberculosis TaxID=1773 RepID=A0A655AH72_MYCTX|nr:Uncharacterised protein [Mycobacterium tuberculosis]CKT06403.1 Uncharacterised protein [Mycobacterium tuberculosis]CKT28654.1 Uncharacterised protein [Mycobacterium tuberculosis]
MVVRADPPRAAERSDLPFRVAANAGAPDNMSGVRQYIPGGKTRVRRAGTPGSILSGSAEKSKLPAATSRRPSATVTSSAEFDSTSPPAHADMNAALTASPSDVRSIDSASSTGSSGQLAASACANGTPVVAAPRAELGSSRSLRAGRVTA